MQQLLLSLYPILSGAAAESIHLMNNGKFNPGLACSTWLRFTREEKRQILIILIRVMSIQCFTKVGCLFYLFISNLYLTALTHFLMLSKKKKKKWQLFPCVLWKLPNNLSCSHLIEMSASQICHLSSPVCPEDRKRGGGGVCTFPLLSKCVNMMGFSCCNDWKIIHLRTRIITANSLMCTRVTLSLCVSIAVLRERASAGKPHCLPYRWDYGSGTSTYWKISSSLLRVGGLALLIMQMCQSISMNYIWFVLFVCASSLTINKRPNFTLSYW